MKKKRIINDIILIAILALIPIAMLVFGSPDSGSASDAMVVITVDGVPYNTLVLNENTELEIVSENGSNYIIVRDGQAWISDADCPEKICVDHNPISKEGEQIVCLPHKVVIEIVNAGSSEIDSLSQ